LNIFNNFIPLITYTLQFKHKKMKTNRILTLTAIALLGACYATAQTGDEIISKYIDAIGGKDVISQISSVYTESTLDVMGNQGTLKTTLVNGKGFKQEIDVMGTMVTFCVTDSIGWQINPLAGNYNAETMQENQYRASRDQIKIGGPFIDYASKGYKVELQGQETIGSVNAYKLLIISPDSTETIYCFDPETYYLICVIQKSEMMGQTMDVVFSYSDYKKTDNGYSLPYHSETNYGGQYFLVSNVTKADINNPIDPAVFVKP
jgi:hypothetical protein